MKIFGRSALALALLGGGCMTRDPGVIKTQVVTFPDGALVEYNGKMLGRAPAEVVLPQDAHGRLLERTVLRARPNSDQEWLFAQTRVFEPTGRDERVPNRIMIDLRLPGTNAPVRAEIRPVEDPRKAAGPRRIPWTDRGKPTQAVGLDRWNPGKY